MNPLLKNIGGDRVIWFVALFLGLTSIIAVYGSIPTLAWKHRDGNTEYYLFKHGIMIVTGFILMYYTHRMRFKYFAKLSQIAVWIAAGLLLLTLLKGVNINSASRWLVIPVINQNFQTSDFAKVVLIVFVAHMLSKNQAKIKNFRHGVLPILIPVTLVCGLILPANFSTAALLFCTCLILMFIGRVAFKHILSVVGLAIVLFGLLILIASAAPNALPRLNTWKSRIATWVTGEEARSNMSDEQLRALSESNYQSNEAKEAISEGGVLPKGPSHGTARNTLPHPYSDMVYAYIIHAYGSVLGGIGVLLLYLILLFRAVRVAASCNKSFGSFLAIGLSMLLVFQAITNMFVATGIIPVTGQPLPLVSMGGTSIWFTCLAIGMILSVSRNSVKESADNKSKAKEGNYATA